ncbi:MAG: hypothetical protein BRD55_11635 [Bacteroidetes bacterium SW_9_63_38]|nr:MAG: hypothetical protein BRD55_11635 [Bacteroidetes bacterium SW_9_63_38]
MSDSLGLKVVNRVEETDRLPFLKALAHIAIVDDTVDLDEKEMVKDYTEAWNLGASAKEQVREILDAELSLSLNGLVAEFSETGTRFLLVQELMRLSHADGTYGDAERKEIAAIAQRMGMDERQFREVEKWVGRGQAWEASSGDEGDEGELEEVLDRDDNEDDDEYDLSDIDTGEPSLDEIDPGGYEFDEEELDELDEEAEEADANDEDAEEGAEEDSQEQQA